MARPRNRLSLYPESAPGETSQAIRENNIASGDDAKNFTAQKSQVLKRLAETLVELDRTEAQHFDALFEEEQSARARYVQQFQSIAGKVQQLSEELEVDRSFRQEYHAAIARYTQEQSQEIEGFAQDMVQLRDLEHMVRGHLPVQLEALAALAHDIQVELRQKADMNATKSRLTQINQRLARLEEVIETKADKAELEAQQERMAAIIPDRNRLARCFEVIAPAIREPSTRHAPPAKASDGPGTKGKAKSKGGLKAPGAQSETQSGEQSTTRASMQPTIPEAPPSPRPSVTPSPDHPKHDHGKEAKAKGKHGHHSATLPKHGDAHSSSGKDLHGGKAAGAPPAGKTAAPTPAEGKAAAEKPPSKAGKASFTTPEKEQAAPKAPEGAQPKA